MNELHQQATANAVLFDLSSRGKIELAGPEALIFLHNLCTNDVKNLAVGAGCEAFLTTAKAKVVAHILVGHFQRPDGQTIVLLDFVPGTSEKVFQHLDHFLISEQFELADRTHEFAMFRLTGSDAVPVLEKLGLTPGDIPHLHHRNEVLTNVPVHVRRHNLLGITSYDIFCAADQAEPVRQALLAAGAAIGDAQAHELLRIEAGFPEFGIDIDENRMVMEVGRIAEAISYKKGCFLGQEPIVMARDRGHVNRTLMGLKVSGSEPVPSGTVVMSGAEEAGQTTSSVFSPRLQSVIALTYMKRGHQEPGSQVEVDNRSAEVTVLPFGNPTKQ